MRIKFLDKIFASVPLIDEKAFPISVFVLRKTQSGYKVHRKIRAYRHKGDKVYVLSAGKDKPIPSEEHTITFKGKDIWFVVEDSTGAFKTVNFQSMKDNTPDISTVDITWIMESIDKDAKDLEKIDKFKEWIPIIGAITMMIAVAISISIMYDGMSKMTSSITGQMNQFMINNNMTAQTYKEIAELNREVLNELREAKGSPPVG